MLDYVLNELNEQKQLSMIHYVNRKFLKINHKIVEQSVFDVSRQHSRHLRMNFKQTFVFAFTARMTFEFYEKPRYFQTKLHKNSQMRMTQSILLNAARSLTCLLFFRNYGCERATSSGFSMSPWIGRIQLMSFSVSSAVRIRSQVYVT